MNQCSSEGTALQEKGGASVRLRVSGWAEGCSLGHRSALVASVETS